jgi:hypothetical protein
MTTDFFVLLVKGLVQPCKSPGKTLEVILAVWTRGWAGET